jgi:hypothetical protein
MEVEALAMREVEIHPAHVWTCEDCGRDNFCRGAVLEFSPEDHKEFEANGLPHETGEWITAPEDVTCDFCGSEFKTLEPK